MINFENAIRMDKIAQMNMAELQAVKDLLTPQESKDALTICKEAIDRDDFSLDTLPIHYLIDALEIKMNSVGYYHHALETTYYDLWQIASKLISYYIQHNVYQYEIALVLYERAYYETDDE